MYKKTTQKQAPSSSARYDHLIREDVLGALECNQTTGLSPKVCLLADADELNAENLH
jgi:hypothetical protein